tara:strand:+ start:416 stop:970 length:555 start_codon:yes stop_codon:yes gene_type:complete
MTNQIFEQSGEPVKNVETVETVEPKKKRVMSEEQKQKLRERLVVGRATAKANREERKRLLNESKPEPKVEPEPVSQEVEPKKVEKTESVSQEDILDLATEIELLKEKVKTKKRSNAIIKTKMIKKKSVTIAPEQERPPTPRPATPKQVAVKKASPEDYHQGRAPVKPVAVKPVKKVKSTYKSFF